MRRSWVLACVLFGCGSEGDDVCESITTGDETMGTTGEEMPVGPQKRIFVTWDIYYPSEIKGLLGADAICQAAADKQHLGGKWRAVMSDSTTSFRDRVRPGKGRYVLVDSKTVVAHSWDDLLDGDIITPIFMTEERQLNSRGLAWTGTLADGTLAKPKDVSTATCNDWTDGSEGSYTPGTAGSYGNAVHSTSQWVAFGYVRCDVQLSLYCIEE